MALKASYETYEDVADITLTGTMSSGAASTWIDLPYGPRYLAAHAVCTGAAKWQIGSSDKSLIRDLVLSTHVVTPTASNAGIILEEALPGGGASIRLFDTSSSSNVWTVWIKYLAPSLV
tara:strand:- start:3445 stop:3801 length:357 start_codon:yes stop_codon:yes gene_type:complete